MFCPSVPRAHRIYVYFVSQKSPHPISVAPLLEPGGICPLPLPAANVCDRMRMYNVRFWCDIAKVAIAKESYWNHQ